MPSPRFNGPSERLGLVVPAAEISEASIADGQQDVMRTLDRLQVGQLALLASEFRIPDDGADAEREPIRASFIGEEMLGAGREEAQHQLRFGQMLFNGRGYYERPVLVAMKPFRPFTDDDPAYALSNEWAANAYLNSVSDRQIAYLPLGVWRDSNQTDHLITLYEHDVTSYDNIFWADRNANPEALRRSSIEHAFADCLRGLGYLHGVGLAHSDAEVKNLAADISGVRVIDTDGVGTMPRTGDRIDPSDQSAGMMRNDLELFFTSTMQIDENRGEVRAVMSPSKAPEHFAQLYRAGLRAAHADTGITMPDVPTRNNNYFEGVVARILNMGDSTSQ